MLILTAVSLTVNVMTVICLAPTIYRYGCSAWEWFEERRRPSFQIVSVCGSIDDDDDGWVTIGYGNLFRR